MGTKFHQVKTRHCKGAAMIASKVKQVRALARGIDVLLMVRANEGIGLDELHRRLALPKATLLRLLLTLSAQGLIWRRIADGAYLSCADALLARCPPATVRLAEIASPLLVELSKRVVWPSVFAMPHFDHLEIVETNSPVARFDAAILGPVGAKLSYLHTATGRAYLAACGAEEREAIVARLRPAGATPADEALLATIVSETRARGYSIRGPVHPWPDHNRQTVLRDGKSSIAVAVVRGDHPIAALNVTWPTRRAETADVAAKHLGLLKSIAARIAEKASGIDFTK